jgi:putative copper resistance protein D
LHYAALTALFGATLFRFYAGGVRSSVWDPASLRRIGIAAVTLALLSGVLWLGFTAAQMSGDASASLDPRVLSTVIGNTGFGRIWIWRLAGLVVLLLLFLPNSVPPWLAPVRIAASALILASLSAVGHAATSDGPEAVLHAASDAAHLLAAGLWLGGLLPLAAELARGERPEQEAVLRRFSGVATVAVAVLVLSGAVNSWFLVGTFEALVITAYGQTLIVKLVLVATMLCLACMNRFWLIPRLRTEQRALTQLRRNVALEQGLGLLVLLVVGILGMQELPIRS